MKKLVFLATLALGSMAMVAFAGDPAAATKAAPATKTAPAKGGKAAILMPAADLKWVPLPGGPAEGGPMMAWTTGSADPKSKVPASFFLKLPANFDSGFHTHDADYEAIVLSGSVNNLAKGQTAADAKWMTAGSYWSQPAKQEHSNQCYADGECLIHVSVHGGFSFKPVVTKAAADVKPAPVTK